MKYEQGRKLKNPFKKGGNKELETISNSRGKGCKKIFLSQEYEIFIFYRKTCIYEVNNKNLKIYYN